MQWVRLLNWLQMIVGFAEFVSVLCAVRWRFGPQAAIRIVRGEGSRFWSWEYEVCSMTSLYLQPTICMCYIFSWVAIYLTSLYLIRKLHVLASIHPYSCILLPRLILTRQQKYLLLFSYFKSQRWWKTWEARIGRCPWWSQVHASSFCSFLLLMAWHEFGVVIHQIPCSHCVPGVCFQTPGQ